MDNKITKSIADLFSNTLKALENEAISPKAYKLVEKAFADATKLLGAVPASAPGAPAAADTSAITAVDPSVSGPYFVVNGEVVKLKSSTLPKAAVKRKASIKSVIIPDCVTEIGDEAFDECKNMETVAIGQGVKKIGASAFRNCSTLKSVVIPDSVTEIGYAAFHGCDFEVRFFDELINVPDSLRGKYVIPDGIRVIREFCFGDVKNLSEVVIPDSVTKIGSEAFSGCSLTSVSIPNSVTTIDRRAFSGCSSLTSVTIPNSVTAIGSHAFDFCHSLKSVTIPASVKTIHGCLSSRCSSLTEVKVDKGNKTFDSRDNCNAIIETATNTLISGCQISTIPKSVTKIGAYAFSDCWDLTSITIPNSVTEICEYAFSSCTGLSSITIPESVTAIGDYAFEDCYALLSVTLPNTLTALGSSTLCYRVEAIYIPKGTKAKFEKLFKMVGYGCERFVRNLIEK